MLPQILLEMNSTTTREVDQSRLQLAEGRALATTASVALLALAGLRPGVLSIRGLSLPAVPLPLSLALGGRWLGGRERGVRRREA